MDFMKKRIGYILFVVLILGGCSGQSITNQGEYQKISPDEAVAKMDASDQVILMDVRTDSEYAEGHIPNSILLTLDNITSEVEDMIPSYDTPIIVYCRSGNRSKTAANTLLDLGYTQVYDLGGIIDWPYDIVLD